MATSSDSTTLQRKIILIIDDEVDLCTLMRNYFRRKDYEVYMAHNAEDAIQFLKQKTPNIILADAEIPHLYTIRKHAAAVAPNAKFFLSGIDNKEIRNL